MTETQYRAVFDAEVAFANGGGLRAEGFRVDVPGPEATAAEVGRLWLASLGLLLAEEPAIRNLAIVEEAHRGTRGGPADSGADAARSGVAGAGRFVDLSHPIRDGEPTYPGLPAPVMSTHLDRIASRAVYAPGTEFQIDRIDMVGNTGTYVDSPFHRYADGGDLSTLSLDRLAEVPAVVVRTAGSRRRAVDVHQLIAHEVTDRAVLLHTAGDAGWGTPAYARDAPYLTAEGAEWLVEHGAAVVGIDAVNIDDVQPPRAVDPDDPAPRGARPAHSALLAAGIPVVEHLTNLGAVPPTGARFTAVPAPVVGMGTFPVRAYARIPSD